jgi:transposase
MGRRSELSPARRREAVLALVRKEEPATKLARRYGISEQTLFRWRDQFLAAGEAALASGSQDGAEARRIQELEKQLADRDQVIGELTIAYRVLKKTSGESS